MRDRLLLAFVALTVVVIGVFLLVRGYAVADLVHAQEHRKIERSAETIAALLGDTRGQVSEERLESLLYDGEHAVYVDADGHRVEASDHATEAGDHRPHDHDITRPVEGGGTITLTRDAEVVDGRLADALLPLVLLGLGLAVVAVAAAVWFSRRLSRPFQELAGVAERIGRGDYDVRVPRYSVPEADTVACALRVSAADLHALVGRERDFAAHASHELRTPLTATRLELEDLAQSPQTPPEVAARLSDALEQLERLSAKVAGMLDASRESRLEASVDIDLAALVRDEAARWQTRARDRSVVDECDAVVAVRLPVGPLLQVMEVLLGNAVVHGEGKITVTVSQTPAYAEVRVADEGPHERAVEGAKRRVEGGGGSLATAAEIVESLGGHLRLTDEPCTTFSVVLPGARRETVAP